MYILISPNADGVQAVAYDKLMGILKGDAVEAATGVTAAIALENLQADLAESRPSEPLTQF